MTPEDRIKQLSIERGAELVGIASVNDINLYAPPGHRPDDILIGAKSVIVFVGRPTTRGAWDSPDYHSYSANYDFFRTRYGISLAVAKFIESEYGYYCVADTPPPVGFNASLSLKLCAEMAGMGTRSMAGGILLNPELGFINIFACLTTMPLDPNSPMKDPVCPHPACVNMWERKRKTPCLDACPECLSGELEDGRIKWMRFDRRICSTRAQNLSPGSYQRLLLEGAEEPDPEVRKTILLGSLSRNALQAISYSPVVAQCIECVRNCPVCVKAFKLKR